eukprot:g5237.t1
MPIQTPVCCLPDPVPDPLSCVRFMSFNIRGDFTGSDSEHGEGWEARRHLVSELIRIYAPDVVGLQEPYRWQLGSILNDLSNKFSFIGEPNTVQPYYLILFSALVVMIIIASALWLLNYTFFSQSRDKSGKKRLFVARVAVQSALSMFLLIIWQMERKLVVTKTSMWSVVIFVFFFSTLSDFILLLFAGTCCKIFYNTQSKENCGQTLVGIENPICDDDDIHLGTVQIASEPVKSKNIEHFDEISLGPPSPENSTTRSGCRVLSPLHANAKAKKVYEKEKIIALCIFIFVNMLAGALLFTHYLTWIYGKEATVIIWNTDRVEFQDDIARSGSVTWLNPTQKKGELGWGAKNTRVFIEGKFCPPKSNQFDCFWLINTHLDHESLEARRESAKIILEETRELDGNDPIIVLGDFNAFRGSFLFNDAYDIIQNDPRKLLVDTLDFSRQPHRGGKCSFNDFNSLGNEPCLSFCLSQPDMYCPIDHIFVSEKKLKSNGGNIHVASHSILRDIATDGKQISDHYAIMTVLCK